LTCCQRKSCIGYTGSTWPEAGLSDNRHLHSEPWMGLRNSTCLREHTEICHMHTTQSFEPCA
jgi:hypothetical protein